MTRAGFEMDRAPRVSPSLWLALLVLGALCASCEPSLHIPLQRINVPYELFPSSEYPGVKTIRPAKPTNEVNMTGGLLHTAEFAVSVVLGGQKFRLQVDTSSGSLVVPQVGCYTCRMGDRRYNVSLSPSGRRIRCDDDRCASEQCSSKICGKCSSRGACCYDKTNLCGFFIQYSTRSKGKGTLMEDKLNIGGTTTEIIFSAVLEETRDFELAYVDGILGMSWEQGTCHPTCVPSVMQKLVNSTGMRDIFTMCVNSFGGTLALGKAESRFAVEDYKYVDMLDETPRKHYLVPTLDVILIGKRKVSAPGLTKALWSSATSFIGIGKGTFEKILEHFLSNLCDIPDLCSLHTWFRPASCLPLEDKWVKRFPDITFMLSEEATLTLTPDDYLIKYMKIDGRQNRCVGFLPIPHLEKRGIGLVLGNTILRRYSVVFDREKRRIGVARCDASICGPADGPPDGFLSSSGSLLQQREKGPILSASESSNSSLPVLPQSDEDAEKLLSAETCRALTSCDGCKRNSQCAFNYRRERCVPRSELNLGASFVPYPNCHGATCMCFALGKSGWVVGITIGAVAGAIIMTGIAAIIARRRKFVTSQTSSYQQIQTFENESSEAF